MKMQDTPDPVSRRALFRHIIEHQPVVLLTKISLKVNSKLILSSLKEGNNPDVDAGLSEDLEELSSGPEVTDDSDEEWTVDKEPHSRRYCDLCTSSYKRQSDLDKHIRVKHGDNCMPYSCDNCHRGFMKLDSLTSHNSKVCQGSNPVTKYQCAILPVKRKSNREAEVKKKLICRRISRTYSESSNPAIDQLLMTLDFRLPCKYKDVREGTLTRKCSQCDVMFDTRTSLVKHFRLIHKEATMPYTCHNCMMGFLDLDGLRMHLSKSKRFCAQLVHERSSCAPQVHVSHSGTKNLPGLDSMPSFKTEQELLYYLSQTSNMANITATGQCVWCPVCSNAISGNVIEHLRAHKQTVIKCRNQNKLLCDVCLVESDNLEWMITHWKLSHGKSLQKSAAIGDNFTLRSNNLDESALDNNASDSHDTVSTTPVVNDLGISDPTKNPVKVTDDIMNHRPQVDDKSANMQTLPNIPPKLSNVIEIVPQDDDVGMPNLSYATTCIGDVVASPRPMPSIEGPFSAECQVQDSQCDPHSVPVERKSKQAESELQEDIGQSPNPPVLMSSISMALDNIQNDMPDLSQESEDTIGFSEEPEQPVDGPDQNDIMMVSESWPNSKSDPPLMVKLEKDENKPDASKDSQSSSENVGKICKNIKERSFMDALLTPLNSQFANNRSASRHSGKTLDPAEANMKVDAGLDSQHLESTCKSMLNISRFFNTGIKFNDKGSHKESQVLSFAGKIEAAQEIAQQCSMNYFKHSQSTTDDQKPGISGACSPSWSRARNHVAESTESDSGVSEVKLDDEDLHDEVIVIDLDDKSVTTQYFPNNAVPEQSLDPGEHQAMLLKTKERNNNTSLRDYLGNVSAEDTASAKDQLPSFQTESNVSTEAASFYKIISDIKHPTMCSADDMDVKNTNLVKCDIMTLQQEQEEFKLLQEKFLNKLNTFLSVISDLPSPVNSNECSSQISKLPLKKVFIPKLKKSKGVHQINELRRRKQYSRQVLSCEECGKGFPSIGILNKHKRFAHPEPDHAVRSKVYQASCVLTPNPVQPKRSPLKMRAYPCSKCGEYFQSLALLDDHKRGVHNLLSKYLCLECDKSFGSRGQLQSHMRWQHKIARSKPPEILPPVTTKAMLKEVYFPEVDSSDSEKHKNDATDQEYKPIAKKRGHKPKIKLSRKCVAPKEYKCRSCDIFFYDLNSRFKHELSHREIERLPCPMCSATFVQQASLNRHMKTHQNIRYVCDICGLVYVQTYSVMYHRQKNHPDAPKIQSKLLRVQLDGPPSEVQQSRLGRKKIAAE